MECGKPEKDADKANSKLGGELLKKKILKEDDASTGFWGGRKVRLAA